MWFTEPTTQTNTKKKTSQSKSNLHLVSYNLQETSMNLNVEHKKKLSCTRPSSFESLLGPNWWSWVFATKKAWGRNLKKESCRILECVSTRTLQVPCALYDRGRLMYSHSATHTYTHARKQTHARTHIYAQTYIHTHTHTLAHTHTYTHTYAHTRTTPIEVFRNGLNVLAVSVSSMWFIHKWHESQVKTVVRGHSYKNSH